MGVYEGIQWVTVFFANSDGSQGEAMWTLDYLPHWDDADITNAALYMYPSYEAASSATVSNNFNPQQEIGVLGCSNPDATNYNIIVTVDNGSCLFNQNYLDSLNNDLQAQLNNIIPEDGVSQVDVDAAYAEGVSSVEVPECEEVATQNIPLDLPQGWSLFGYTCLESLDVVEAFSGVSDNIEIVKDEWGLAYLPSYGFSAFDNLEFGEGYQIKMIEEVTDFQFCSTIIYVDECGVPNGDNSSCTDECGMPNGDNSSCTDVCGVVNGDSSTCLDECGVLNGDNSSCTDCAGVLYGTSEDLGCGCGNPPAQDGYDCDGNEIELQIGDIAHGGIVFRINEDGSGLVADLQDLGAMNWDDAMSAAESATSQGYNDWYLPSLNELIAMKNTIAQGGDNIGGFAVDYYYWSSGAYGCCFAWYIYFAYGNYSYDATQISNRVRVIRAF